MLQPGTALVLTIEKPAAGGRMLARHHGEVVLVAGTLPGETVRARVEKASRGVVYRHNCRGHGACRPIGDP